MDGLLGQLKTRILGRKGRAWAGSVEDLLFDGEEIRRTVSLDGNRIVVTSHRLLAFTPDHDGENYHQVDLPNVSDVRSGYAGEDNLLEQALRLFVYGGVLLAVGFFVDFGAIVPTDAFAGTGTAAGQMGMGGLIGAMEQFLTLIAQIDEFARAIGALLVLFAVFVVGVYLLTRDDVLVVSVAGDDADITVPTGEADADPAVADLERTLFETSDTSTDPLDDSGRVADGGFKSDDAL